MLLLQSSLRRSGIMENRPQRFVLFSLRYEPDSEIFHPLGSDLIVAHENFAGKVREFQDVDEEVVRTRVK
jgi:hypothetical protein